MLYGTLPRQLQASYLVDTLMGTSAADVYDAIFDVDAGSDIGLWSDEDEDDVPAAPGGSGANGQAPPARRYLASMEGLDQRPRVQSAATPRTPARSPDRTQASLGPSPVTSPRRQRFPRLSIEGRSREAAMPSPLARLYGAGALRGPDVVPPTPTQPQPQEPTADAKELRKVRDELKEVKERQARIENLLLVLTRGMRNEVGSP
jgi:hypothetical protein